MTKKLIAFSKKNHIANITLNHPTINQAMAQELAEIFEQISGDDDIYVVTLLGTGSIFCQGGEADISGGLPSCCRYRRHRPAGYRRD